MKFSFIVFTCFSLIAALFLFLMCSSDKRSSPPKEISSQTKTSAKKWEQYPDLPTPFAKDAELEAELLGIVKSFSEEKHKVLHIVLTSKKWVESRTSSKVLLSRGRPAVVVLQDKKGQCFSQAISFSQAYKEKNWAAIEITDSYKPKPISCIE